MIFVVTICLTIHCTFYVFIFGRLALYKEKGKPKNSQATSIVICYHNEERNASEILPSIIKQKFSELILVNDQSTDGTLKNLNKQNSNRVNVLSTQNSSAGKKAALSLGIQSSKENIILLTDADCVPASNKWASHMSSYSSSFVLGYGPMNKIGGIVSLFSRFETYMSALQYLSYALAGIPYMGVGRNMRIDKKVVLEHKEKIKGSHLASGDDDLMINALATKDNTCICIHPESFMYSDPKTTLKTFLIQKTRHISTSAYYKPAHKILLSLFSAAQILFFLGLILGITIGTITLKLALLFVLCKWGIQQTINFFVMRKLKEDDLFWKVPLLDILYFIYLLTMPFYYLFNKNNSRWS